MIGEDWNMDFKLCFLIFALVAFFETKTKAIVNGNQLDCKLIPLLSSKNSKVLIMQAFKQNKPSKKLKSNMKGGSVHQITSFFYSNTAPPPPKMLPF